MIKDIYKVKRSLSDVKQKKSISDPKLKIRHPYSSIEQSDLSSLNSLNKNEHYKSAFEKKTSKVVTSRPKAQRNVALGKSPF